MNHTNTITPRWCLLTALFAMAITVAVPPAAIAQTKKTDLPPQKSATALGSFTTTEGKTYDAVKITKVNPDSISFVHSAGVATIAFEKLPPDVQRRFNYAPKAAAPSVSAVAKPQIEGSGIPGLDPPTGNSGAPTVTAGHSGSIPQNAEAKPSPAEKYERASFTKTEEWKAMEKCKPVFDRIIAELGVEYKVSGRDAAIIVLVAKHMAGQQDISESELLRTYAGAGIKFATSKIGKQLQVLAATMSNMLDSQLASIKMQGGSSGLDFIRGDGMAALVERGDLFEMELLIQFVAKGGLGERFNVSNWLERSEFLTAQDAQRAGTVADFVAAGHIVARSELIGRIATMVIIDMSPAERAAIGQSGGMRKLLDHLDATSLDDPKKILAGMKAMGLQMDSNTLESLAGKLAQSLGAIRSKLKQSW